MLHQWVFSGHFLAFSFFSLACELWHMHPHLNLNTHLCHIFKSPPQSVASQCIGISILRGMCECASAKRTLLHRCFVADCVQLAAIWLKCLHFSLSKVIKCMYVYVYLYLVRWVPLSFSLPLLAFANGNIFIYPHMNHSTHLDFIVKRF